MTGGRRQYRPYKDGEKIEAAFLFQAGTVWASWESVYQSCRQDPLFEVKLIYVSKTAVETAHSKNAMEFLKKQAFDFVCYEDIDFMTYRPHVVFIQFPYDAAFHTPDALSLQFVNRGSRVVYIPYGIEIADTPMARMDHFNSRVVENAWRIYVSSEGIRREYDKYCRNARAVRVTGSPKFDSVFYKRNHPMNPEYQKMAGDRKIVIWKMHFPKKNRIGDRICMLTPDLKVYWAFANKMKAYQDFFFIVMPHPKMLGRMAASDLQGDEILVEQVQELMAVIRKQENAVIDTTDDYRNSLYHADAVIMDRSGVVIEAAMLEVPVLFMKNADYDEPMVTPVREVTDTFQRRITPDDMCSFIETLRDKRDTNIISQKLMIEKWFPYMDGSCGDRVKEDIKESILAECEESSILNVVLYGTGEIASYYMEKQKWAETDLFCLLAVADSDQTKWGNTFYGRQIIAPNEIKKYDFDVVVVMTEPHFYEIQKQLVYDLYLDDRRILRLDEFVMILGESR